MIDSLLNFTAGKLKNGIQIDLLWTNSSPTSSFAGKTISLSGLSNCAFALVEARYNTASAERTVISLMAYGKGCQLRDFTNGSNTSSTATASVERWAGFYSTEVAFGDCYFKTTVTSAASVNNKYLLPTRIWGIRVN